MRAQPMDEDLMVGLEGEEELKAFPIWTSRNMSRCGTQGKGKKLK